MKTTTKSGVDLELKKCYPFPAFHYGLGVLLLIIATIVAAYLWPEHPWFETAFKDKAIDYLPSFATFTGGFFACIFFCTVGRVLSLMQSQLITMRHMAVALDRVGLRNGDIELTRAYNVHPGDRLNE